MSSFHSILSKIRYKKKLYNLNLEDALLSCSWKSYAYNYHTCIAWYYCSFTMMAKEMKTLELPYPMIQLLMILTLLIEHKGHTGEYWPEVMAVRTECSEVRTKTTKGQYSQVRLERARLVSSLLYGTQAMLV